MDDTYKLPHPVNWRTVTPEFKQRAYQLGQYDSIGDDARIGWWAADRWDM